MKLILKIILLTAAVNLSAAGPDQISIAGISFKDAKWDNSYNIYYSRNKISDFTNNGKAVVLYFFTACFS